MKLRQKLYIHFICWTTKQCVPVACSASLHVLHDSF